MRFYNPFVFFLQGLLGRSGFLVQHNAPVVCSCQDFCNGQCFSSGCQSCRPDVWSFSGGEKQCMDPGPLGDGLLCKVDLQSGSVTDDPCCMTDGTSCRLPHGECCSKGSCTTCPEHPPPKPLFENLSKVRQWHAGNNTCTQLSVTGMPVHV